MLRLNREVPIKEKNASSHHELAHREGRTRSLQIVVIVRPCTRHKSLTLYPIELGGRPEMNRIMVTRHCSALHIRAGERYRREDIIREDVDCHLA